ncbi:MAG: hypothetical protein JWP02_1817 [Acidimicrobiales bacterium]|nr:hypothetical protein [Acidimicrobiales bacterium]
MTAAVEVATRMPALNGILFRLLVLALSPFLLCGLLVAFDRIDAFLTDRRPVRHADGGADDGPPPPEPLPTARGSAPGERGPSRRLEARPGHFLIPNRERGEGMHPLAPNRKEAAIWPRDPAPPVSQ